MKGKVPSPTVQPVQAPRRAPQPARVAAAAPERSLHDVPTFDPVRGPASAVAGASESLPWFDRLQRAFGRHDLTGVRTTRNDVPLELRASAVTFGDRIAFGARPSLWLAAHEAAHVIQQRRGVEAAAQGRDSRYEHHADAVADAVVAGLPAEALLGPVRNSPPLTAVAQFEVGPMQVGVAHQLPTSMLLEIARSRLQAIDGDTSVILVINELTHEIVERLEGRSNESPDIVRQRAIRLNAFLVATASVFSAFPPLEKASDYPDGVAAQAVELVRTVSRAYAVALQLAFNEDSREEIFTLAVEIANEKMAKLPDQLTVLYLSPSGLEKDIHKVDKELRELQEMRNYTSKAPLRGRPAETMMELDAPRRKRAKVADEIKNVLDQARLGYAHGQDVAGAIQDISVLTRQALGIVYAMQVYEQLDLYVNELDNWINSGVEIFGREILEPMRGYRQQADDVLKVFERDYRKDQPPGATVKNVQDGLKALSALVNSPKYTEAVQFAEKRMQTIARIRLVGKIIAVTAIAAMTGTLVAEFAGAGALLAGASEGGLVVKGVAFTAEVLTFTAVQRRGMQWATGQPNETSFAEDAAVNAITFGALKASEAVFTKAFKLFANPEVWKLSFGFGKAVTGFATLAGISELHYAFKHHGKMMPGEERIGSWIENVVLLAALEGGRFFSEPLVKRLAMPALRVKMAKRMDQLEASRTSIQGLYQQLLRGQLTSDQIADLTKQISAQWVAELTALHKAAKDKVITEAQLKEAMGKYEQATAELELQLARINANVPVAPGRTPTFRALDTGVVAVAPENLGRAREHYERPDASGRKGSFTESKEVPGAWEGRSPSGELTFFVPEGMAPKRIPDAAKLATARDQANKARRDDELAASGLAKLESIFNKMNVDEILANVAPDHMLEFLRALGDPTAAGQKLQSARPGFLKRLASSVKAIRFARRYGLALTITLDRRFDSASVDTVLDKAEAQFDADPDGAQKLREALEAAKSADEIKKMLGEQAAKKPRRSPVRARKTSLSVERDGAWKTRRAEVERDFTSRGWTRTAEQIDNWTDCLVFFEAAKRGRYKNFGRKAKLTFLDAFDAVAKAADVPSGWISANRGNLSEALLNPGYGKTAKKRFFNRTEVTGAKVEGETVPDYQIDHGRFTEYVNQKSDLIDREPGGGRPKGGAFSSGRNAAKEYLKRALVNKHGGPGEALNIPAKDRYSLDFVRDPGPATVEEMLEILFRKESPIFRVKFGDGPWHQNPNMK